MPDDRPFAIYRRLIGYTLRYRGRLAAIVASTAAASVAALAVPWLAKTLFRDAVLQGAPARAYGVLGLMLLAMALLCLFRYIAEAQMTYVSLRMVENLRRAVMAKLVHLPIDYFVKTSSGDALARCFGDVSRLRAFLNYALLALGSDLLLMVGALGTLFYLNWRLTLTALAIAPVGLLLLAITSRRVRHGYTVVQQEMSDLTSVLAEQMGAMPAIRAFGGQEHEINRFGRGVERLFQQTLATDRFQAAARGMVNFIAAVGVVIVLAYGARAAVAGSAGGKHFGVDDLIGFALYAALLAEPITRLSRTNYEIQQSLASGRRVFELLDLPEEHEDFTRRLTARPEGRLTFESVGFSYRAGEPVLQEVDLDLAPGETAAVVGPSGAGKSSLSYLPLRFYSPKSGRVLLDGVDVSEICAADLREHIGWVGQEPFVFSGTVAENIAYGSWGASHAEIEEAARLACADEFIRNLPLGYDARLGERGVDLSGGQRARLAIARVVLRAPAVVIFDECTAALDAETESLLWRRLAAWRAQRTTLIIAHRLLTVLDCPRIIVLERGKLVGDGSAEALQRDCHTFNRLFEEQMNLAPQRAGGA